MKSQLVASLALVLCAGVVGNVPFAAQLAFPEAEGYGKNATGGRGGTVYEVTNLNASGAGSLGAALGASGKRSVVFRVGGTINGDFNISKGDITIAGQTAPGDGIAINGSLGISASNVIIRYIRVRGKANGDVMGGRYNDNIMVDHVSTSWSSDEIMSIYHGNNVTIQWCMITEACSKDHRFGAIWGNNHSSYHHNLFAHNTERNPRIASGSGFNDFRNNVIYNWTNYGLYGGEKYQIGNSKFTGVSTNVVANYMKPGPATGAKEAQLLVAPWSRVESGGDDDWGKWYVADNIMHGNAKITADNWEGVVPIRRDNAKMTDTWLMDSRPLVKLNAPSEFMAIKQQTAEAAYASVLAGVGCSFPKRDAVDARIIGEVRDGKSTFGNKGIIDAPGDVGGAPKLAGGTAPADSDHDGMSDDWEKAHDLNPNDAKDGNGVGPDGYTNLEIFLNSLVSANTTGIEESARMANSPITVRHNLADNKIEFTLSENANVRLDVLELSGRTASVLMNESKAAGTYAVNLNGKSIGKGLYVYRLSTARSTVSGKMLVN